MTQVVEVIGRVSGRVNPPLLKSLALLLPINKFAVYIHPRWLPRLRNVLPRGIFRLCCCVYLAPIFSVNKEMQGCGGYVQAQERGGREDGEWR